MLEITDTNFRCNACGTQSEVQNFSLLLNDKRMNFRLCKNCRKQLKRML